MREKKMKFDEKKFVEDMLDLSKMQEFNASQVERRLILINQELLFEKRKGARDIDIVRAKMLESKKRKLQKFRRSRL